MTRTLSTGPAAIAAARDDGPGSPEALNGAARPSCAAPRDARRSDDPKRAASIACEGESR